MQTPSEKPLCDEEKNGCFNVYVANLPPTVDQLQVREIFSSVGKVVHVKLLLDIATGVSRGIAFVMFEDLANAKKACVLKNKTVLDNCVLQVRLAERSALHSSVDSHTRSNVVYIRNVPGATTKEQVRSFCVANFGVVKDVTLHPQSAELNGPSPYNMVFVTFETVDEAIKCVEGIDGKTPFPLPQQGHPFTMAKMISDVAGEMRKSILIRRRPSESSPTQQTLTPTPKTTPLQSQLRVIPSPSAYFGPVVSPPIVPLMGSGSPQSPATTTLTPKVVFHANAHTAMQQMPLLMPNLFQQTTTMISPQERAIMSSPATSMLTPTLNDPNRLIPTFPMMPQTTLQPTQSMVQQMQQMQGGASIVYVPVLQMQRPFSNMLPGGMFSNMGM